MRSSRCAAVCFSLLVCATAGVRTTPLSGAAALQPSNFNGGNFQVNMNFLGVEKANIFINAVKSGSQWSLNDGSGVPLPSDLDSNGYPLPGSNALGINHGVYTHFYIASQADRPGYYAIDWQGGCGIQFSSPFTAYTITGSGIRSPWIVDPARASNGSARPTYNQNHVFLSITNNSGGCANLRMYYVGSCTTLAVGHNCGDYDLLQAGKMFVPQFVNILKDGKAGLLRMLNWWAPSIARWMDNKPVSYVYYQGSEYRNAIFATPPAGVTFGLGPMTGSGNTYLITCATGTFCAGAPFDKEEIIVQWAPTVTVAATSTWNNGATSIPVAACAGINAGMLLYDTSISVNRNAFQIGVVSTCGSNTITLASGAYRGSNGNTDNLELGPGIGAGPLVLNLNGTASQVTSNFADPSSISTTTPGLNGGSWNGLYYIQYPVPGKFAYLVYDAGFNLWQYYGGDSGPSSGMPNSVPPAAMMELCNEVGAHCWINIPTYALDPNTAYDTALAQLAQTTLLPGLKLYVEPPNETWNYAVGFWATQFGSAKAKLHWPHITPGALAAASWTTSSTTLRIGNCGPVTANALVYDNTTGKQIGQAASCNNISNPKALTLRAPASYASLGPSVHAGYDQLGFSLTAAASWAVNASSITVNVAGCAGAVGGNEYIYDVTISQIIGAVYSCSGGIAGDR